MRPTGASLKLQGPGDRNAHFEGASSPATKGKYKNTRTRHKAHCPEPLQLERSPETSPASAAPSPASPAQRPAEAPRRPPVLGPGQEAQRTLRLSSESPAGHPLRLAWCCSKLTGPDAIVSYLVVKVCLISSRLSLPVTGLCFYEGSLLLLEKEVQSPEAPGSGGGGGCGFFLVKRRPCASPGSATVWAPWEPGVGAGVEAPEGREDQVSSPTARSRARGGDGRGPSGGRALRYPSCSPFLSSGSPDTPASRQPTHCSPAYGR